MASMHESLLIENGTLLSTGGVPSVRRNHSILIKDGLIARIAPGSRIGAFSGKRIDASGKVVVPGLINAHTHLYSTFARGMLKVRPSHDFMGVLRNLWWRLDCALTEEDCYSSALVALIDSIRHGTTTLIDHHASPRAAAGSLDAIARAVGETGLRACLCYEVSDRHGARSAREGLDENARFIRKCQEHGDGNLRALFGLHASFTLSDKTLEEAAGLGHSLGAGFHIHAAEALGDQQATLRTAKASVIARLEKQGILGRRSVAAHCVHVSQKEIDMLAQSGTAVAHNPQSNLNNAVGTANVVEMARRGAVLGLGTDAMTANMLEELRVALWAQRAETRNPSAGFKEVTGALFDGNPRIASRIFGLRFGELRKGCVGDVAIFDYDPPTPLVSDNALGHALFGLSQARVDTTVVGGRVLMEHGRLLIDVDEERANERARELARNLWQRS
jgi:putative selenium metabolism protein SsnA